MPYTITLTFLTPFITTSFTKKLYNAKPTTKRKSQQQQKLLEEESTGGIVLHTEKKQKNRKEIDSSTEL